MTANNYWGINVDLAFSTAFANWDTATKASKKGFLTEGNAAQNPTSTLKYGLLQASSDTAVNTPETIAYAGHVFGRLGQGKRAMPVLDATAGTRNTAFRWSQSGAAASHGMYVSILPFVTGSSLSSS